MAVSKFEELVAWQKARLLVKEIYLFCRKEAVSRDFGFSDQLRSAAVSTMSSIAEGFERHSTKEFARFLSISIASGAEVRSQLYAALDLGYATQEEFEALQRLATDAAYVAKALRTSLVKV